MSELKQSLLEQIAGGDQPDIGKAFKKLLADVPVTNYDVERERFLRDRIREQEERIRAESQKR